MGRGDCLLTCNTDLQEISFWERLAVFLLYRSVHEPSDTSLVLKLENKQQWLAFSAKTKKFQVLGLFYILQTLKQGNTAARSNVPQLKFHGQAPTLCYSSKYSTDQLIKYFLPVFPAMENVTSLVHCPICSVHKAEQLTFLTVWSAYSSRRLILTFYHQSHVNTLTLSAIWFYTEWDLDLLSWKPEPWWTPWSTVRISRAVCSIVWTTFLISCKQE